MNCSARRPCFIDHFFLTFDFCQVPRPKFLQFFPFLVQCCFAARIFTAWCIGITFVTQVIMLQWILTFSCNMVFVNMWFRILHTHSGGFTSFRNTCKFCPVFVRSTTPIIFQNFTRHSKSDWCFQLLTRVLDRFFWIPCPLGQWNRFPNFLALSSCGFSCYHFCLFFSLACFLFLSQKFWP